MTLDYVLIDARNDMSHHYICRDNAGVNYLCYLQEKVWNSDEAHPGPTAPTSTPSSARSSESAMPMASTSPVGPEAILLQALKTLSSLPLSFGWSLNVDCTQSNISHEVTRPAQAAPSHKGLEGKPLRPER